MGEEEEELKADMELVEDFAFDSDEVIETSGYSKG